MAKNFLKQFQNEDWISTIIGIIMVLFIIFAPAYVPKLPPTLNTLREWGNLIGILAMVGILSAIGIKLLGESIRGFAIAFFAIFTISVVSQYICTIPLIKNIGFEPVFFSVAFGLLIRNTIGLPKWMSAAVRSEYYIKGGLVLLGTSVVFSEIMKAGAMGMIQALVVVISVWYFSFWLARKLKVDKEMSMMLASAVSICGVSAAIATCGAIKGDSKKLSFVVSMVLVVAVPMMYIMPYFVKLLGLSQEVAGAWLGGTIDTTGAVVASGKFVGDVAETYSVIIKSSQNVLLGVAAFAISIYWSYRGTNQELKPTPKILWDRFPKFVVGFIAASVLFSFLIEADQAKELGKIAKGFRETMFSVAFVCIGLETDFRHIFKKENKNYITTFLVAQSFNIVVTLIMALLLFGKF